MDTEDFNLDDLFADMPEVNRLGFFTTSSLDLEPDYEAVIAMLRRLAEADEPYTDEDGYEWDLIDSTVDEENRRLAWVEWREKERGRIVDDGYYLKARDHTGALLMWEIETYNPYFGCSVKFLKWMEDAVILIYEDKHDTFVARLKKEAETKRVELSDDWQVNGRMLTYRKQDETVQLQLPSLDEV